jgi:hypothetical protein
MTRFMRVIHVFLSHRKDVDGPDKPGHDDEIRMGRIRQRE